MIAEPIFSFEHPQKDWNERHLLIPDYGNKAAGLVTIPREWTPPFILFPKKFFSNARTTNPFSGLKRSHKSKLLKFIRCHPEVIIRSSVINESIWDSGSYKSVKVTLDKKHPCLDELWRKTQLVIKSANDQEVAIILHSHIKPLAKGTIGNLLRVSKTKNHWEINFEFSEESFNINERINSQRDRAANPDKALESNYTNRKYREFGRICAWINNELLPPSSSRVICEWIITDKNLYLVQITEEDEDVSGFNPIQMNILATSKSRPSPSKLIKVVNRKSMRVWEKLNVLDYLWSKTDKHNPTMYYIPLSDLGKSKFTADKKKLVNDFMNIFGKNCNIVIRTSARVGWKKEFNLARTDCLQPKDAVRWIYKEWQKHSQKNAIDSYAFIIHHFISSKSSAWVKVEKGDDIVEIHSLWGLPDGLQFSPHDYFDVYTETKRIRTIETPQYKPNVLICHESGEWQERRVKNEIARSQSISKKEAIDIATRSRKLAERIGKDCHIMWFVGCKAENGEEFNLPWYFADAIEEKQNTDRARYRRVMIRNRDDIDQFRALSKEHDKSAIELNPDVVHVRDSSFIEDVGKFSIKHNVPIYFSGSTLAHAYYEFTRMGVTVIPNVNQRKRARELETYSKIVRDGIPEKIENQNEVVQSFKIRPELSKKFLISKIIEEALELNNASNDLERTQELADIHEVLKALTKLSNISMRDIQRAGKEKKRTSGAFDEHRILQKTSLPPSSDLSFPLFDLEKVELKRMLPDGVQLSSIRNVYPKGKGNILEIPFTCFGFLELDGEYISKIPESDLELKIVLSSDKLIIEVLDEPQLSIDFDD